jgi:hypothetical protein
MQAFTQHSPLRPLLPSSLLPLASVMKFTFEIKTKRVTQASFIVAVVAFSSGSLASIAIYSQSPSVSASCAIALEIIIYSTLHLAPCQRPNL